MDVSKQVNEMEYFLNISEHLKVVLDRFSNQESTDRNDLYDLVYSKRKLEELKNNGISNTDLLNDVNDLLSRIQLILDMLKPDDIENIIETKIKNPSKLNKAKYGKKDAFENVTDSGNVSVISKIGGFNAYFRSRIPKVITLIITLLLMIAIPNILDVAFLAVNTSTESTVDDEKATDVEQVYEVISNTENFKPQDETFNSLKSVTMTIIRCVILLIFSVTATQLVLDMLYIVSEGQMGKLLKTDENHDVTNSLISTEAQDAVIHTYETEAHKVNSNDRIEVASALLNNMINYITNQKDFVIQHAVYTTDQKRIIESLDELRDELQEIKGRALICDGINMIEAYVDAEITYEQLRKSMNKELDWLNNLEIANEWS